MSLNGLDTDRINDAFKAGLSESGGWFLLKYTSRDEVDLLGNGAGGIAEARAAIEQYREPSPLYGFLQYRRRKVLLKYVPDGTSRLVQARVTVHFQTVCEAFPSHDSIFSLSSSAELTENALSSACLLHTASASVTSSGASVHHKKLQEITEDSFDPPDFSHEPDFVNTSEYLDISVSPGRPTITTTFNEPSDQFANDNGNDGLDEDVAARLRKAEELRQRISEQAKAEPQPDQSNKGHDDNPEIDHELLESFSRPIEPRDSMQSSRPSFSELNYGYKKKVKLGPRPSIDVNRHPYTSGSGSEEGRPVAALPAGLRMQTRKSSTSSSRPPSRPRSRQSLAETRSLRGADTSPLAVVNLKPSSASVRSFYAPITVHNHGKTPPVPKSPGIPQEKMRLMKALELRRKQMAAASEKAKAGNAYKSGRENAEKDVNNMTSPGSFGGSLDDDRAHRDQISLKPPIELHVIPTDADSIALASSPTSGPDPSDGPSTQASSVTDEHEHEVVLKIITLHDVRGGRDEAKEENNELKSGAILEKGEKEAVNKKGNSGEPSMGAENSLTPSFAPYMQKLKHENTSQSDLRGYAIQSGSSESERECQQSPMTQAERAYTSEPEVNSLGSELGTGTHDEAREFLQSHDLSTLREQLSNVEDSPAPSAEEIAERIAHVRLSDIPESREERESRASVIESESDCEQRLNTASDCTNDEWAEVRMAKSRQMEDSVKITDDSGNFDDTLPSDDSFFEELQSATVQEARPIAVGTPVTPLFPKDIKESKGGAANGSRAVSNPAGDLHHARSDTRSSSASFPQPLVAKKINVSSGISSRIKALERFSHQQDATPPSIPTRAASTSNVARKSSFLQQRWSRSSSRERDDTTSSPAPAPTRFKSQRFVPKEETLFKRESVSVAAKIIRTVPERMDPPSKPSTPIPERRLSLAPIEQNVISSTPTSTPGPSPAATPASVLPHAPASAIPPTLAATARSTTPTPGLDTVKYDIARSPSVSSIGSARHRKLSMPRSESRASIFSTSSRDKSDIGPRSASEVSSTAGSSDERKERKGSRKSRLLKRMSSGMSLSKMSILQVLSPRLSGVEEDDKVEEETETPDAPDDTPSVVDVGDVNVQFPDTLLWKRRFLRIDDQGYLILTASRIDDHHAHNVAKRYHLSEFNAPCIPDLDRQELPYSVLLDFHDGSTLQCACESKQGQVDVLNTLSNAYHAYHQLYG